ncbi:MAG TPA: glycosyltransferase [Verrucomicrobiae bacterium]|nr:glycosyltransferase [Verrucomicrobiae bacterium]
MHVTLYKPGKTPIPPKLYGGTERIIYWLGKALVQLGHRVTLIANAQSEIPGAELCAISPEEKDPRAWLKLVPDSTDIVHLWDTSEPNSEKPFVVTVEGNGQPGQKFHPNTIFISRKHAENHGSKHFVHNGLDVSEYKISEARGDYAVFLAKASWSVKNLPGTIEVARRAGIELRVLGSRNWPLNLQKLLPPIRGVRYLGMIGGKEKADLLARARCLIFPVRWHEPFGIAVIEALASGAFVAGTPYGSLPDIVTPEVGVLSADANELVDAVRNPQKFSPQKCREHILKNGFSHLDMARKYLKFYERVLSHGTLSENDETPPMTKPGFIAKQLLPWEN